MTTPLLATAPVTRSERDRPGARVVVRPAEQ